MWQKIAFAAAIVVALSISLLWPGDAPFIYDEPYQLYSAYIANQSHTLAHSFITGNVGLPYGPLATWIYQIILAITIVPSFWVIIKSFFTIFAMAAGLFLVARATGLWKWIIPIALSSPYIWFYSRHLSDNPFLLPFSTLAIGTYAYYLSYKSSKALLCAFALSLLLPLIHLMAIPLSAAILLHMGLFAGKQTGKVRAAAAGIVGVVFIFHAEYFSQLLTSIGNVHPQVAQDSAEYIKGWIFPLLGGRLLSAWGLEYFFRNNWLPHHPLYLLLKGISCLAYFFVFTGMYFAGRMIWQNRKQLFNFKRNRTEPVSIGTRTHLSLIALTSLLLYIVICGLTLTFFHPHYYNSLWIIYLFFAWITIDKIVINKWGMYLISIYGASCVAIVAVIAILVHERGGTRDFYYGPTINNQLEIIRDIGFNERSDLSCSVKNFIYAPSLSVLRVICINGKPGRKQGPLIIEFANDDALSGFVRTRSGKN